MARLCTICVVVGVGVIVVIGEHNVPDIDLDIFCIGSWQVILADKDLSSLVDKTCGAFSSLWQKQKLQPKTLCCTVSYSYISLVYRTSTLTTDVTSLRRVQYVKQLKINKIPTLGPVYMEESWPGAPGHYLPSPTTWKKREPGYDELPLSTDWNISVRMLCVRRLGPARRVDSLETVTWEKVGSPPRVTPSRQPSDPTPRVTLPSEPGLQFLM